MRSISSCSASVGGDRARSAYSRALVSFDALQGGAGDLLRRVVRKAEDVAGICDHADVLPGLQHLAVFPDLVLPLLAEASASGSIFSNPMKTRAQPPRAAFSMKP